MGRVGASAYDVMHERYGECVHGLDSDASVVANHCANGRNIEFGDPTDRDLWDRLDLSQVFLVMLTTPSLAANLSAIHEMKERGFEGSISAVARYDDEIQTLTDAGAHSAYNVMGEAGFAFADHVCETVTSEVHSLVKEHDTKY